mmetsp:Transcript_19030/g.61997  ORF Transcript_19030/g.61997 Transcript_19030/m.61997 type:complete len:681 (-) Transcript_19030:192-2234(-)
MSSDKWSMHTDSHQPLFSEYLNLTANAGWGSLVRTDPIQIGPVDCLIVVDMQNDFVPLDLENPDGGAFAVPEGNDISPLVVKLMEEFADKGGLVVATRDYHPKCHCSFLPQQGPFPEHCVQGSIGSHFYPPIGEAIKNLRKKGRRMEIVFKGFHEDVDSFGSFQYADADQSWLRVSKRDTPGPQDRLHGCTHAAWTGAVLLYCSNIEADVNAPPDILATRRQILLGDYLREQGIRRVFACGLALDFCVLDTCANGVEAGFSDISLIMDAARSAHLPGLGSFGSGFISDPKEMKDKMAKYRVQVRPTSSLIAGMQALDPFKERAKPVSRFPESLGPFALVRANKLNLLLNREKRTYSALGPKDVIEMFEKADLECKGFTTEPGAITLDMDSRKRAGIPEAATKFCWAYPVGAGNFTDRPRAYMTTTSPSASFFVFGGFVYMADDDSIVSVMALTLGSELTFKPPIAIPVQFTTSLMDEVGETCMKCFNKLERDSNFCGNCGLFLFRDRWQPVTMPWLTVKGARWFSFFRPGETVKMKGNEGYVLPVGGEHGAFAYLFSKDPQAHDPRNCYFPVENSRNLNSSAKSHGRIGLVEEDDTRVAIKRITNILKSGGAALEQVRARFPQGGTAPIHHDDFMQVMTQLDPTLKAEHLETLFRAVDKDGDGKVKFNHFTDWLSSKNKA